MRKLLPSLLAAAAILAPACVKVDSSLGKGLVDKSLLFDTYTVTFPLEDIQMKMCDGLSGYSDSHLTIGAIRDDVFGLTTREAAFNLIPLLDTLDLGTDPKAVAMDIYFERDTVSCSMDDQAHILQNIYVTELTKTLPGSDENTASVMDIPHGTELLTDGIPVYNGEGALSFNFTKEYAQKVVDVVKRLGPVLKDRDGDTDKYEDYVKALPGIYIETDKPEVNGGRINLFNFSSLSVSSNYYTKNNNVAFLKVHSTWDGVEKDSTFVFLPGETEFEDEATYLSSNLKFYQYCFNRTGHSTTPGKPGSGNILVEGGGGLKPVISARELKEKTIRAIEAKNGVAKEAIIVKATIVLPYQMPEDYLDMKYFPSVLSPTIRKEDDNKLASFAGLTDASVSTENQGDLDRSRLCYSPDITYHLQETLKKEDKFEESDIWLLTIHTEKVANASGSLYDNSYYQNLLYASYYNSLYGGGYGGYGYGYSSYGYGGYSNYYNYMMLAQMMAASTEQSYSYTTELDKDRYYCAILNGPTAQKHPYFQVTFAIPQRID